MEIGIKIARDDIAQSSARPKPMSIVRKGSAASASAYPFTGGDGLSLCPPQKRLKSLEIGESLKSSEIMGETLKKPSELGEGLNLSEIRDGRSMRCPGGQGGGSRRAELHPRAGTYTVENATPPFPSRAPCLEMKCADLRHRVDGSDRAAHVDDFHFCPPSPHLQERNYLDCVSGSTSRMGSDSTQPQRMQMELSTPVLCKLEPTGQSHVAGRKETDSISRMDVGPGLEGSVCLSIGYGARGYGGRSGERNFISGFGESHFRQDRLAAGGVGPVGGAGAQGTRGREESPKSSVESRSGESCRSAAVGGHGGAGGSVQPSSPSSIRTLKMSSSGRSATPGRLAVDGSSGSGEPSRAACFPCHMGMTAKPCEIPPVVSGGTPTIASDDQIRPSHHHHHHQQQQQPSHQQACSGPNQRSLQQKLQSQGASSSPSIPFCSVCSMAAPMTPPAPAWKANDSRSELERQQRAKSILCCTENQKVIEFFSENRFKITHPDHGSNSEGPSAEGPRGGVGAVIDDRLGAAEAAPTPSPESSPMVRMQLGRNVRSGEDAMGGVHNKGFLGGATCPGAALEASRQRMDGTVAASAPSSPGEHATARKLESAGGRIPSAAHSRSADSLSARSGSSIFNDDRSHSEVLQSVDTNSRFRTRSPPSTAFARTDDSPRARPSAPAAAAAGAATGVRTASGNVASFFMAGSLLSQGATSVQSHGPQSSSATASMPCNSNTTTKSLLPKFLMYSPSTCPSSPTSSSNKELAATRFNVHGCISGTTERSSANVCTIAASGQITPDSSNENERHGQKNYEQEDHRHSQQQQQQQQQQQREEQQGREEQGRSCSRHKHLEMNMNARPSEEGTLGQAERLGLSLEEPVSHGFSQSHEESDRCVRDSGAQPSVINPLCPAIAEKADTWHGRSHFFWSPDASTQDQFSESVAAGTTSISDPSGSLPEKPSALAAALRPGASWPASGAASGEASGAAAAHSLALRRRTGKGMSGASLRGTLPLRKKGRPSKSLLEITICSRKKNPLTGKMMVKETGAAKKKIQKIKELLWDIVDIVLGPKEAIGPADVDKALAVVLERGIGGSQARNIIKLLPDKNPGSIKAVTEDFLKIIRQDFNNGRMAMGPVGRGGLKQKALKELKNLDTHGVLNCSWSGIYLFRKADMENKGLNSKKASVDNGDEAAEDERVDRDLKLSCRATARSDYDRREENGSVGFVEGDEMMAKRMSEGSGGVHQTTEEKNVVDMRSKKRKHADENAGSPLKDARLLLSNAGLPWRGDEDVHDGFNIRGLNLNQMVHA